MNVPRLRFKDDNRREFPEWEDKKLGDIVDVMQSGVSRMLSDADIGLPVIRSNNLINNKLNISDIKYWYTEDNQGVNLENYFLKEGDLLVNFINSLAQIGKIALFENTLNRNTIFTTNLMRLSFRKSVSSKYISCFFQTNDYIKHIQAITKPAVNQASFTTKEFKALRIPLPTFPEQTKIANFLTAIDEKITQLTQKCDLLAQYKKGVMQQIFSQKLRFKDDDGREFPGWEETTLGNIATFFRGGSLSKADISTDGQFECVHYGELFTIYSEVIRSVKSKTDLTDTVKSEIGDILMPSSDVTPAGLARASCILKSGIVLGGDINIIRLTDKIEPIFISYLLNFDKNKVIQLVSGTTVKHIYIKDIKTIPLTIPKNMEEQTKIAKFLTAIDDKIPTPKLNSKP